MNKVSFMASRVLMAAAEQNDIYMTVVMRMFSTAPNRNGFAVSEAFIDNIVANAAKYTCLPQCADAGRLRNGGMDGLTHRLNKTSGIFESEQIGSFFSFAKEIDNGVISLLGEARIPKRNPMLCETLMRLYEAGALNFSFEILVGNATQMNGITLIDAAEGNELIGMAVVTTPACPEATALKLIAEDENDDDDREDEEEMDEKDKKIAELEAQLKLAEQKATNDEEIRKKDEQLENEKAQREKAEAELAEANTKLAEADSSITNANTQLAEKENLLNEKDARIAELEEQINELTPFKAEVEQLRADKAAAELAAKQQDLTRFAEAQGLDVKETAVAEAIQKADYAALIAESMKHEKPANKPVVASYAMGGGITAKGEYDDLLSKA